MPANDIGAIYTPSIYGRTSFPLRNQGNAIFYKTFDGSNPFVVGISSDIIKIPNHFFKTGEKLIYNFSTGKAIGIGTTSPGNIGFASTMPTTVYPIVVDKDKIRISLSSQLALAGEYVNITSVGVSTVHSLLAEKQNSKCLISVDNIIQSPISIGSTVGIVTYTNLSVGVKDLKNIKLNSLLQVESEIVKVSAINYSKKLYNSQEYYQVSVSRGSGVLGTSQINFTDSILTSPAKVLSGTYNIVKDIIYFAEAPLEGKKINLTIPLSSISFEAYSFSILNNEIITGSQCVFFAENLPVEFTNGGIYYLIRRANNSFQFADTLVNAFSGIPKEFSNQSGNEFPITDFQLFLILPNENSSFNGRVFLRSNYDGNAIFDDISEQFTGISSSFELKVGGISTVGISSDNGIVLINNVFQYPEFEESFTYSENGSQTFINFIGSNGSQEYDVNVQGLPRGGIIVSYGTSSGINYQPLIPANGIALVSAAGTITSVIIGNKGSGYRTGLSTVYVEFDGQGSGGSGAIGEATINPYGYISQVSIINGGSGYEYSGMSTSLTTTYNVLNDGPIGVGTTSIFEYYRGKKVSTSYPGYIRIENEVLKYTGIDNLLSQLTGISRGMFNTIGVTHSSGVSVIKDEYRYYAKFNAPIGYENVTVEGSLTGIGASVSFKVLNDGQISDFIFTNPGFNYKVGDVLKIKNTLGTFVGAGIGTVTQSEEDELKITIQEVAKDEFSAWNVGRLRKLDDLTSKVNGKRKVFTLTETFDGESLRVSLESELGSDIDLAYNLLVFINDILQVPNSSYTFKGGSQIIFSDPIPLGSTLKIYFYSGYEGDAQNFDTISGIKEGDKLQIQDDIFGVPPTQQRERTVKRILSSDTLRTEVYTANGLSESSAQFRAITWTPQKADLIISGEYVSKSRRNLNSGITSLTKLTEYTIVGITTIGITTTSGTFSGINTNVVGINTSIGIGSMIKIRDYVEGEYLGLGVTIISINGNYIGLSTTSSSPSGISTIPLSFYSVNA